MALPTALASEEALTTPDEGCGVGIPAACRGFEPVDDVVGGGWGLSIKGAADEDALDRLGHVQPGATERGVQRHDAMLDQPEDKARGLVAGQVVEDQQHPQGREVLRESEPDGEPCLPAFPGGASLRFGLVWRLRERREDGCQFGLKPGVEHRVGTARDALDANQSGRRMEQGQQLGGAMAEMLVGVAFRTGLWPPARSGLGDRLVRAGLVLGPDWHLALGVRVFDQPLFTVASGSWTSTSPALRRRFATPVWHHERSRCQLKSASCSTHQMV